ncbi:MAG: DUF2157 domain-containing protein [Ilumatobacter sp.]|nr:DUF2157 domain-containing protein [Ilumatobacter sp.]
MNARTGDQLQEWVDAELLTPEQATAIRTYEAQEWLPELSGPPAGLPPPEPPGETAPTLRFTLAAEVASYVGSVLALFGGAVVVGSRWRDVGWPSQVAIALVIALVGFGAGAWLRTIREAGTDRFAGVMWVLGTGGGGLALGVVLHEGAVDAGVIALAIGTLVLVLGLALWRNLDRPLQMVTAMVGVGIGVGGLIDLTGEVVWPFGIAAWIVAATAFALAHVGRLRPRVPVLAASGVGALLASGMLSDLDEQLGAAVAAVTAVVIIVFGLVDHTTTVLVVGVVGFVVATQALLATTFTGVAASGIVTLVGLVIVIVAVVRSVRGANRPA